jgi:hypothetical protein
MKTAKLIIERRSEPHSARGNANRRNQSGRICAAAGFFALSLVAIGALPQPAVAQTAFEAPTEAQAGSLPPLSAKTIELLRRQVQEGPSSWPPEGFRPENGESIQRKLQSGEYTIDRHEKPWFYYAFKITFGLYAFGMCIKLLRERSAAKKSQQVAAGQK